MERYRGDLGGALVAVGGACWIGAVLAVAGRTLSWTSAYAIGLVAAGFVCLVGAIGAFGMLTAILRPIRFATRGTQHAVGTVCNAIPVVLRSPIVWRGRPRSRVAR
jgi:hypothetical protein